MGTPSSPVSQLSSLRQAYDWLAHGGGRMLPGTLEEVTGGGRGGGAVIAACMKARRMAKAKCPRKKQGNAVRPCAWCANLVHGEAVTVTFPDKEQATFHGACLYTYRAVMGPRAARSSRLRRHPATMPAISPTPASHPGPW
jgi:hypothetical protein